MFLIGEELRSRPLVHLGQLSAATKDQLRPIYTSLAEAAPPRDPAAPMYLTLLNQPPGVLPATPPRLQTVIACATSRISCYSTWLAPRPN